MKSLWLLLFLLIACSLSAQKLKKVKEKVDEPFEHTLKYQVLKSDPSVKHGSFKLLKGIKLLEEGNYKEGKKVGAWIIYDFETERPKLTFDSNSGTLINYALGEQDYDNSIPSGILSNVGNVYNLDKPIILKTGKATVFYAIKSSIKKTLAEDEKIEKGSTQVQWLVSKEGQISNFSIVESSSLRLRELVLNAVLEIKYMIECYPASKDGVAINAYYNLLIEFN